VAKIVEGADPVWELLVSGWLQSLTAEGKAQETLTAYGKAATALINWMMALPPPPSGYATPGSRRAARAAAAAAGQDRIPIYRPAGAEGITQDHIERFLVEWGSETTRLGKPRSDSAINQYFRSLQQWFAWLIADEEIEASPMANLSPPKIGERLRPILAADEITALLKACQADKTIGGVRDEAIIRVLADSGGRRSAIAGLDVDDVDIEKRLLTVISKGDREHQISIGLTTARVLNRYLRKRAAWRSGKRTGQQPIQHNGLWISWRTGDRLTPDGLYQAVQARGREIGIRVHPHLFRHTLAHEWLDAGGGEQTLMDQMGWSSPQMLKRYGAAGRAKRAHREHDRLGLGDRY